MNPVDRCDHYKESLAAGLFTQSFNDKEIMPAIPVLITRFVDDHQPGFVECFFVDALGETHTFVEKVPVVSTESLCATSPYPCDGVIECEIEEEWSDKMGRAVARVSTARPWGMESTTGLTRFIVVSSQLESGGQSV